MTLQHVPVANRLHRPPSRYATALFTTFPTQNAPNIKNEINLPIYLHIYFRTILVGLIKKHIFSHIRRFYSALSNDDINFIKKY